MNDFNSNYYDCNKDDELMIDPRLMEYMKKKKFYEENNIESKFLDKEFAISKTDIIKIKSYLKGDKKTYDQSVHRDFIDPSQSTFPSSEFKKDPRFERIKIKQKKETDANEQRYDYGIISKSYDMYRNDRPFASASGNDFSKSNFHPNDWFKNSREEMLIKDEKIEFEKLNKPFNKKSFANTNTYVNPKSNYNSYLSNDTIINNDNHTIDSILGQLDTMKRETTRIPYRENEMDLDFKRILPNNRSGYNQKTEYENNYQPVPFMQNGENGIRDNLTRDIDIDTFMRFGTTPLRAGKSLGYPSTMEHNFNYISPDIQNPDHVVMDRGVSTRAYNKDIARSFKRDMMK